MSCTNCALSVDKVLTGSGMQDVKVNFMNGEASFSAPENTNKKNIQKEVNETGCLEIYVGLPKHLSGAVGQSATKALNFANQLAKALSSVSVRMMDERLTTTSASARLSESGLNTREQKSMIDQVAAIELLEQALEFEKRNNQVPGKDLNEVK